jgi:hypothetical protein
MLKRWNSTPPAGMDIPCCSVVELPGNRWSEGIGEYETVWFTTKQTTTACTRTNGSVAANQGVTREGWRV